MASSTRVTFPNKLLPYLLLAPQLAITAIFFYWPASQAIYQSVLREDPFGLSTQFVGLGNFRRVISDPNYVNSLQVTVIFSVATALIAMALALLLAVMADKVIRGKDIYRTLLIWPYAVAPAIAGMLWLFLFNPSMGTLAYLVPLRPDTTGTRCLTAIKPWSLIVSAAAWKQISYNFLFFVAGLQSIPKSLIEAAAIDGAGETKRFWTIVFPLLAPTTFFLLVVNTVYAFFDTFGIIHAVTGGGPGKATETLVYKVYNDGFVNLILGELGGTVSDPDDHSHRTLTAIQFRYVERKVHYG